MNQKPENQKKLNKNYINLLINKFKNKKIGLCIGSGAARGYAAIPIIEELENLDININLVSGCSVGSIIGAYYCLNGEINSLYEKLEKMSKKNWLSLIDLDVPTRSLIKGKKIKKFLQENFFQDKTFEDLKIPLVIVSTNLNTNKVEYFTSGLLIDAIMASISIPGIFPTYKIENNHFIDGGIKENLPYDILFEKGMHKVIGIDFNTNDKKSKISYDSSFDVLLNTFYMLLQTSKLYENKNNLFVFQPVFERSIGDSMKFYQTKENYNSGSLEFKNQIDNFFRWLK